MNIRLDGIEYEEAETESALKAKIDNALKSVDVDISPDMFVRFHRSSAPYTNKDGKTVSQCIMRFASWKQRRQAHVGKKKAREEKLPIFISHDLTKRRYDLFKTAARRLKQLNIKDTFAFVDVNSNLAMRNAGKVAFFNTHDELNDLLNNISR